MTKQDMEAFGEIIKNAVAEGISAGKQTETPVVKSEEKKDEPITKADVESMIAEAIKKATGEEEEKVEEDRDESIEETVQKAVAAAIAPFMKQTGLPTNLDDSSVQKSEEKQHYLHGFI